MRERTSSSECTTVVAADTEEATNEDSFQYSDESSLFKMKRFHRELESGEKSLRESTNKVRQVALDSPDAPTFQ